MITSQGRCHKCRLSVSELCLQTTTIKYLFHNASTEHNNTTLPAWSAYSAFYPVRVDAVPELVDYVDQLKLCLIEDWSGLHAADCY